MKVAVGVGARLGGPIPAAIIEDVVCVALAGGVLWLSKRR